MFAFMYITHLHVIWLSEYEVIFPKVSQYFSLRFFSSLFSSFVQSNILIRVELFGLVLKTGNTNRKTFYRKMLDYQCQGPGPNPINKITEQIYSALKFKSSHWLKLVT